MVLLVLVKYSPPVSMYHYRSRCNTASVYESLQRAEERRTMASSDDGVEIESDEDDALEAVDVVAVTEAEGYGVS